MKLRFNRIKIIIAKTKKKFIKTITITVIISAVIIGSFFVLMLINKNKIARGVRIADIPVGNLSINEARTKVNKAVKDFLEKEIILRYKNEKDSEIWTALPEEMGIKINVDSTLAKALKIGHQKEFSLDLGQQILALFGSYNLPLNFQINEIELENFIRGKLNSIDNPAVDAGLKYDEKSNKFVRTSSREGMIIDRQDLESKLQKKVEKLAKDDIYLNLIYDTPEILENEVGEAYLIAKKVLANAPYKLLVKDPQKDSFIEISLTKKEMIILIEFWPVPDENNSKNKILGINLDSQGLNDYLTTLSSSINREPINARLVIERDRVTDFALPKDGVKLEIEKNIQKIREEILNKNNQLIELEVSMTTPKIATKDIDNLGITSLIGKGVSNFAGSPKNRIHNIGVGAAKFNGVLIESGKKFSFNTILGEIGPEQGYKPELVIKQDKTVPEYGGGLCQVSTTTFRAAINSGLPIAERAPHAFPVVYYNPQGFDATIYPPHPDLRFINDTPGYLLIQTKIEGNNLTFEFYGTSDGRKVEIEGPIQYDMKSDGSMKAKLTRKIYKNDELVEEKTWYSNYKSPALYPVQRNPLE